MSIKKLKLVFLFLTAISIALSGQNRKDGFAIVTDGATFKAAEAQIMNYANQLEKEGFAITIIKEGIDHPDSIRKALQKLYVSKVGLKGAVFIGNIPIPMVRDAQHMATAFKMDQERYAWSRSSVASDRFYEDFDLQFKWLKKDDKNELMHYYALLPDSPQRITPDIYSGRILIKDDPTYAKLKKYLEKVVEAHKREEIIDEVLVFAGHGYNSESMAARIDEKAALLQQFPQLSGQSNGLEYMDFTYEDHIKYNLLAMLERQDLDLAILHHHGGIETQYLSGVPSADGVNQNIDAVKFYLRSKYRDGISRGKSDSAAVAYYVDWLDVPESWLRESNLPGQLELDSIYSADMDIDITELSGFIPNAKFILFDACFNGSFYAPAYVAGEYVFGPGMTVAAQGNTVNVIQDKFPDEMIGLLSMGIRVGEWNKYVATLETHIIGDPTFRFAHSEKDGEILRKVLTSKKSKALLKIADYPHPDVQSLVLRELFNSGYGNISGVLTEKYYSSKFLTVRMECLKILSIIKDDNFVKVTASALDDSYELIRRHAANFSGRSGNPELIGAVIGALVDPNISKRVNYQLTEALSFFEAELLLQELERTEVVNKSNPWFTRRVAALKKQIANSNKSYSGYLNDIISDESPRKEKVFAIRAIRNKNFHQGVEEIMKAGTTWSDSELQVMLLEALGWFEYSYKRDVIIEFCDKMAGNGELPLAVREEAVRTRKRLE